MIDKVVGMLYEQCIMNVLRKNAFRAIVQNRHKIGTPQIPEFAQKSLDLFRFVPCFVVTASILTD